MCVCREGGGVAGSLEAVFFFHVEQKDGREQSNLEMDHVLELVFTSVFRGTVHGNLFFLIFKL